jgi:hypothetical protein
MIQKMVSYQTLIKRFYSEPMKISLKIFLLTVFLISAATGMAQVTAPKEKTREVKVTKTETLTDSRNASPDADDNSKTQDNGGNKNQSVKQVKSARPDMSRSRGARPPDIVRPSGSRIPKGVGKPAGAVRHGRG